MQLPKAGIRKLDVVCPGFVIDCLETLEEINIRGRTDFLAQGGKEFNYIPCMNEEHEWVAILAPLVEKHLHSWLTE